jgi:hypothetical protein
VSDIGRKFHGNVIIVHNIHSLLKGLRRIAGERLKEAIAFLSKSLKSLGKILGKEAQILERTYLSHRFTVLILMDETTRGRDAAIATHKAPFRAANLVGLKSGQTKLIEAVQTRKLQKSCL